MNFTGSGGNHTMNNETNSIIPASAAQPDACAAVSGGRSGMSRRSFLRYAGIGFGTVVFANPLAAFADEDDLAKSTAAVASESDNSEVIADTFGFGGGSETSKFVFDPEFFSGSSFNYSNQIGTFGCCLALSALGSNDDKANYTDSPKHAKEFLEKLNCKDVLCNDWYTKETEQNSIGLICGHRTITAGGKNYELVLMGIRGANYFYEWCGNLNAGKDGADHEGFANAANQATAFLKSYINEKGNVPTENPLKVVISGYSRASATANMTGGYLVKEAITKKLKGLEPDGSGNGFYFGGKGQSDSSNYLFPNHEAYQKDMYVYAYEAPSGVLSPETVCSEVQSAWKKQNLNPFGNMYSIVNMVDFVTKVMPFQWKFGRFGTNHLLPQPKDGDYATRRDAMMKLAKEIKSDYDSIYPVDKFDHMDMPMNMFFDTMYDKIIKDLTGSRATFNRDYETPLIHLMSYMVSGKINKLSGAAGSGWFKAMVWTNVISDVLGALLVPGIGLIEFVVLVVKLIKKTLAEDLLAKIVAFLRASGLEWGDEEQRLYDELKRLCPMIQGFIQSNPRLFIAMCKTFMKDANTTEVHGPVLCLAWMQSYDSNYSSAASAALTSGDDSVALASADDGTGGDNTYGSEGYSPAYMKVLFDGDITVSMVAEKEVKLFERGERVDNDDFDYWYGLNEDYQMYVFVPIGSQFMFKIESSKDDNFTITVVRHEDDGQIPARILSYNAVGDGLEVMYANVTPNAIALSSSQSQKDVYEYEIDIDNAGGDEATHCDIDLKADDDEAGRVVGGGYNVYGTSSLLIAAPEVGYEFDYWSVNGERDTNPVQTAESEREDGSKMLSAMYQFYVNNDYGKSVEVVAHFKKVAADPVPAGTAESAEEPEGEEAPKTSTAKTDDAVSAVAVAAGVAAVGAAAVAGMSYEKAAEEE